LKIGLRIVGDLRVNIPIIYRAGLGLVGEDVREDASPVIQEDCTRQAVDWYPPFR
jgi:hypothetical protein